MTLRPGRVIPMNMLMTMLRTTVTRTSPTQR